MPPAARIGDLHTCPAPRHVGGPIADGSLTVNIGGASAARVGDHGNCQGGVDTLVQGSPSVLIEGRPAVRSGDRCAHSGTVITGFPSVIIGNDNSVAGLSGGATGSSLDDKIGAGSGSQGSDSGASAALLGALASLGQQVAAGGGTDAASQAAIQSVSTALEVALARSDLAALGGLAAQLQQLLQEHVAKKPKPGQADAASTAVKAPTTGWQKPGSLPGDPPKTVGVREGRLIVNGGFAGIHAISEIDLIDVQAGGRVEQVVQRLIAASTAGRNCARIFCMYDNVHGELSPWTTPGYWTAIDALIKRLAAYGMFGEFVLFADCDRRPDGSGGVMPSWDDRRAFVREAGQFFKGKPVIVNGMNEPPDNGASAADDPRLLEVMAVFRDASAGTVPFSVADPRCITDEDARLLPAAQQIIAGRGTSILVVHGRRQQPDDRRYRWWIDRLKDLRDVRNATLPGAPYLYHNQPMTFGSRHEDGRLENDPEAAVAAACVAAIGQMGFCYHRVATDDMATPGLELARVATFIPQSPDFIPYEAGAPGAPIERFHEDDFPGGGIQTCFNGAEAWAVGYGKRVTKNPRVDWSGLSPEVIWRGDRVILWRAKTPSADGPASGSAHAA